jgi:hypothetical protein
MNQPRYFFSVFGDPSPPDKDTIESGVYHPDPNYAPFPPNPGDILLCYGTLLYRDYSMAVPGIGVVLGKDKLTVQYRYLPFDMQILKSELNNRFEPKDVKKLNNIRFSSHWLFEISKTSFLNVTRGARIKWP